MTVLIVRTVEFEPLVILSGDESDLSKAFAAIFHRITERADPFIFTGLVIFSAILFPEGKVAQILTVRRQLETAALFSFSMRA